MIIKANYLNCNTFKKDGKELHLITCANQELGTFNFFSKNALKLEYLKEVQLEFSLKVYNSRLALQLVSIK